LGGICGNDLSFLDFSLFSFEFEFGLFLNASGGAY